MMKSFMAALALVIGLSFGAVTFVQADEKAPAPAGSTAAPAEKKDMGGEKKEMGGEKKAESKKETKKKKKK